MGISPQPGSKIPISPFLVSSWSFPAVTLISITRMTRGLAICLAAPGTMQQVRPSTKGPRCWVWAFLAVLRRIGSPGTGSPNASRFPNSCIKKGRLEFSFSGLKTALLYKLQALDEAMLAERTPDLAAGYQEAIVTVLVEKAFMALRDIGVGALAVVGGVSANSRLRSLLQERATLQQVQSSLPPLRFSTHHAAH